MSIENLRFLIFFYQEKIDLQINYSISILIMIIIIKIKNGDLVWRLN